MLRVLAAEGYRSLRDLTLRLGRLTLITGPNGSGKTSTYRVLRLLADAAHGSVAAALAREGGLESVRWAGPEDGAAGQLRRGQPVQGTRRRRPIALRLGFAGDDVGYALDLGLPALDAQSMFFRDPEVKRECIWHGPVLRPGTLLTDRSTGQVRTRGEDGRWDQPQVISPSSSLLTEVADPRRAPEVLSLRDELRSWRFYDAPRTDPAAPARLRQLATRTQVMAGDGSDLAAALQTIRENGDDRALHAAIDAAFPGTRLEITDLEGHLDLRLRQTGLLRPLAGSEVSDGTLRYLLWTAALLSPRPAPLLVLNEPETSLHPSLLEPLAALISQASEQSQTVVVTHSSALQGHLHRVCGQRAITEIELDKVAGETRVRGQARLDGPAWTWPAR